MQVTWPEGKSFAFTVFDDTDDATLENVGDVYSFLADCGFRTTKSVWVLEGDAKRGACRGQTCEEDDYRSWAIALQRRGFEIAFHNATWHSLPRREIQRALERFAECFGHPPATAANHTGVEDSMYWGDARLSGWRVWAYNLLTRFHNHRVYRGHIAGDEFFWGDFCQSAVKYYRNFVFRDINTLKMCPFMPYHDPARPLVNHWFASSDGHGLDAFVDCLREVHQDRLEREGGACIMYTHFARGFKSQLTPNSSFRKLMTRLARKNGWFVPVSTLLDHLLRVRGRHVLTDAERRSLENRWLREKLFTGTN